jgi:hypothetical protein
MTLSPQKGVASAIFSANLFISSADTLKQFLIFVAFISPSWERVYNHNQKGFEKRRL